MKTLKGLLTNNFGLKLLSIILAALMWFLVTNMDDPSITVRFYNIPVTIRNANQITEQGKMYEVLDGTDTISSVAVVAPRSIADTFTRDNIIATADMNNLSSLDTLSINLSTNKYFNRINSITGSIDTVRLAIENRKSRTLALSAITVGTLEEGYIVGTVSTEQNVLRITGPESAIDRVTSASVSVDVTGFKSEIDTYADISLYDAEGTEVTSSSIHKNINDVRVTVSILQTKRVPITASVNGTPADGYVLTGAMEISPDSVLLAGRGSAFQSLEELAIPGTELDVTGLTGSLETAVNLRSLLPTGVTLGDSDFGGQVSVKVDIAATVVAEYELPVSQIALENIPEGMRASIQTPDLDGDGMVDGQAAFSVRGLPGAIGAFRVQDVQGVADLSEIPVEEGVEKPVSGPYTVAVNLTLPRGITLVEPLRINVYLEDTEQWEDYSERTESEE